MSFNGNIKYYTQLHQNCFSDFLFENNKEKIFASFKSEKEGMLCTNISYSLIILMLLCLGNWPVCKSKKGEDIHIFQNPSCKT